MENIPRKAYRPRKKSVEMETSAPPIDTPISEVMPIQAANAVEIPKTPATTTPWKADIMKETTWRPGKKLEIPAKFKDSRFVYRFASTTDPSRVRQLIADGWEVDRSVQKKMEEFYGNKGMTKAYGGKALNDGTSLDSTWGLREMLLMRITKEEKEKHDAYYREIQDRKMRVMNAGRGNGEFEKMGLPNVTYGSVETRYEKLQ